MIENDFDTSAITSVNFGVRLRSNGSMYFVPTDAATKAALGDILRKTEGAFNLISSDWAAHDISEDYGARRRVYADRSNEFMSELSTIYDIGALTDLTNLGQHAPDIDYYFASFVDNQGRRAIGIKKANRFKGAIKARNRLVRLVDDTLVLIQDDVLRLDEDFDVIVTNAHVFIFNVTPMEHLAKIGATVAATAAVKVQALHDAISFIDFSRIKDKIATKRRMARQVASIALNPSLGLFKKDLIVQQAEAQGIKFTELPDGRLQCRVADESKLIELLDFRRYRIDLSGDGGDRYRASARQKDTTS